MRRTALAAVVVTPLATFGLSGNVLAPASASSTDLPSLGPGFLWGTASAGFQSEGYSPDSNWSRYAAKTKSYDPVGTSVDFLHRYNEDIALAKGLGVKVYRISVEWARVEPTPGHQDPAAWAFYDHVIAAIKAAGMRPMITLDHWVYPGWEVDKGGWARAGM